MAALVTEVLAVESAHALHGAPSPQIVDQGVRAFIRAIDRYGDYLSPDVLASVVASESGSYGGVGLEVYRAPDGRFFTIPLPGGPAARAGIVYGRELLAVAGHETRRLGVEDIGFLLRGSPGSAVILDVAGAPGETRRRMTLVRERLDAPSVAVIDTGSLPGLRIVRFTPKTPESLIAALAKLDLSKGLVLDVRGNVGGDLSAAVRAASLFLDPGAVVGAQQGRSGEKVWRATGRRYRPQAIYLWQDRLTASAAEVFVAALVENRQAVSLGQASFGKGVAQGTYPLAQGGALRLTTDTLKTPRGNVYDGIGLAPSYPLQSESPWSDAPYREKTRQLAGARP